MVVRTFSMSAGLDASTVTPGSTAPELSIARPPIAAALVPCADASLTPIADAKAKAPTTVVNHRCLIAPLLWFWPSHKCRKGTDSEKKRRTIRTDATTDG